MANTIKRCISIVSGVPTFATIYDATLINDTYVNVTGDTMTGLLNIDHATPTINLRSAASTLYGSLSGTLFETFINVASTSSAFNVKINTVPKLSVSNTAIGSVVPLNMDHATPAINLRNAAGSITYGTVGGAPSEISLNAGTTATSVNTKVAGVTKFTVANTVLTAVVDLRLMGPTQQTNAASAVRYDHAQTKIAKAGGSEGVMTGDLQLMSPQQTDVASATRKDYVDGYSYSQSAADARYVQLAGYQTLTGPLTINTDPHVDEQLTLVAPSFENNTVGFYAGVGRVGRVGTEASTDSLLVESDPGYSLVLRSFGPLLQLRGSGSVGLEVAGSSVYIPYTPSNFIVGSPDASSGGRHRLYVPNSGNNVYYDFDGLSGVPTEGLLVFRCHTTNIMHLSITGLTLYMSPTVASHATRKDYVDGRTAPVIYRASKAAGTSYPAGAAADTVPITGWTTVENTGGWTSVGGVFTVPEDGTYTISERISDAGGMPANIIPWITASGGSRIGPACMTGTAVPGGTELTISLAAGQTVQFNVRNSSGSAQTGLAFAIEIVRVSI